MADNENHDEEGNVSVALPWYDFEPGVQPPNHVTHLRIGVRQAVAAAGNGAAPEIIMLSDCSHHPNLQRVQIHVHTVELIPWHAFACCTHLEQVEFVASTRQSSVAAATSNPPVQSPRLTRIGGDAFRNCRSLHSVIGMENVSCSLERIGVDAFGYCPNLTTLDLSCLTRLQLLELFSFDECKSLTVVDLSNSVLLEAIRESTFWNCTALRILHLPPNLKRIYRQPFCKCAALVSIVIPASVEFMLPQAFWCCSSLTRVRFQSTRHLCRLMDDEQFSDCTSLHTLELEAPPIRRKLWPLLMEQFLGEGSGILSQAGIPKKQRITIAWNFVRANITNFYVEKKKKEKPTVGHKEDILSLSSHCCLNQFGMEKK